MATPLTLYAGTGGRDGFRGDLPLKHELPHSIVVDGSRLASWHPMFVVRLRLFLDWHLAAGRDVRFTGPHDTLVAQRLGDMGLADGLPTDVVQGIATPRPTSADALLPVRRLHTANDVEDAAAAAMDVLHDQVAALAAWGDPVFMAVSELCGNALQHGRNPLGAYVAADRIDGDARQFRLAIADLGIGIPEHIRHEHPEWQDDTAAITRALDRGVSGTGTAIVATASPRSSTTRLIACWSERGPQSAWISGPRVGAWTCDFSTAGRWCNPGRSSGRDAAPGSATWSPPFDERPHGRLRFRNQTFHDPEDDMTARFTLSDFGQTFATRERGAELREELLRSMDGEPPLIIVDFAGVTNVSSSFADEFLGRLCEETPVPIDRQNTSPRVARIVDRALERRTGARLGC